MNYLTKSMKANTNITTTCVHASVRTTCSAAGCARTGVLATLRAPAVQRMIALLDDVSNNYHVWGAN